MSDLHCPARLLVARHGDAEYASGRGVLTMDGGRLTANGRRQVATMANSLLGQGIVRVYGSHLTRAQESAAIVAQVLDVEAAVVGGLEEYEVGDLAGRPYSDPQAQAVFSAWMDGDLRAGFPGGETGAHIIERFRVALKTISDQHRGERVVVISHGGVMSLAIPRLSTNLRDDLARRQFLPNAVPAVVDVDGDGIRVESWPGSEDKRTV